VSDVYFNFSTEVIPIIIREIDLAEKYIKISMFQIHNEDIFRILSDKLRQGVKVEILTLPYDGINKNIRQQVEPKFRELERNGATIYFCRWNVGDPGRTTTATGRWYLFHGKFIVTDKSAISLSANFTQTQELDAVIVFRNDYERIKEFNGKFDELLDLFVNEDGRFDGNIHRKIVDAIGVEEVRKAKIFELPDNVDSRHKDHWIRHYPIELCSSNVPIEEKLYITPFDCKGRNFVSDLIKGATEYVYISTESFTDIDFPDFLVNISVNKDIDIKILSGTSSMDFTDRINNMFRDLIAQDIDFKTTSEDIHAKLIITDKCVVVSSINLNKINLGFSFTSRLWRENTETILVCKKPEIIRLAKERYLEVFNNSYDVKDKLAKKLEDMVKTIFTDVFQLKPKSEVKALFAKFILKKQIDIRKLIVKIGKIAKKLGDRHKKSVVEKEDFISALVLYYLSERKLDYDQLKERVDEVDENVPLSIILNKLRFEQLIEKEGDYYKINVETLIS